MVRKYEARGTELGGDAFYEDWVEVVRYEDYKELDDSFQDYVVTTEMEVAELVARLAEVNAEVQKYKDQFPYYVECANCGSVTHVEGVEDTIGQSGCRKEDTRKCEHDWYFYDKGASMMCKKCGLGLKK